MTLAPSSIDRIREILSLVITQPVIANGALDHGTRPDRLPLLEE
jgi:hypothetical protein